MSEQRRESNASGNDPTPSGHVDPSQQNPPGAGTVSPEKPKANPRRKLLLAAAGALILAGVLWFGIPWVQTTMNTVSTDDAYVNGHVTFVAARVKGQVSRVLVDDNYRVRKGDLLVELDREPFQIAVAVNKAAVDTAMADGSIPTTRPPDPTTWAARRPKTPVPQATSRTRAPRTTTRPSRARSAKRRPKAGSKCWA